MTGGAGSSAAGTRSGSLVESRSASEDDTLAHARRFARALRFEGPTALQVHLLGGLGAGKTTWVRGLLQGLGVTTPVRSPTYSLMELYDVGGGQCLHADLYRLADGGDLDTLGFADHDRPASVWFIEWPERAAGQLPAPELIVRLERTGDVRRISVVARGPRGQAWLDRVENDA